MSFNRMGMSTMTAKTIRLLCFDTANAKKYSETESCLLSWGDVNDIQIASGPNFVHFSLQYQYNKVKHIFSSMSKLISKRKIYVKNAC